MQKTPLSYAPVQVVWAREDSDYRQDKPTSRRRDPFCEITKTLRGKLAASIDEVKSHFADSFKRLADIPAVAKVELRPEAIAKSHRPVLLFNDSTCPIIGGDVAGELLIGVTSDGLDRLRSDIEHGKNPDLQVNISTLKSILPFDKSDVLDDVDPAAMARSALKQKSPVRLRLFRHESAQVNDLIDSTAKQLVENRNSSLEQLDYGDGLRVYAVHKPTGQSLRDIASFVGTQGLSLFPEYSVVKTAAHVIGAIDGQRFPPPPPAEECGLVGIIDTGTDRNNSFLEAFVEARYEWLAAADQGWEHGTFVGGLIANARALNHGNVLFPSVSSRIVDIVALDKDGAISEYDFITVVEQSLKKFPKVRVWNLSLSQSNATCRNGKFSMLGMKLDALGKKHKVLFVVAAGNYTKCPPRRWPSGENIGELDRICPPADTVRGLTVGSLAHLDNSATLAKAGDPSPFTRRGSGPHFYIKPEAWRRFFA